MTGGVRLYHPTARSGIFTVEHHRRPYRVWNRQLKKYEATPLVCSLCAKAHAVKTYHITVDHDGFAFVSRDIWELMQTNNTAGFHLANEVGNPPALQIGLAPGYVPRPQSLDERN